MTPSTFVGFYFCVLVFFSCSQRYLIEHGAHVGAVNSEGELPLDVATEDAMERLLKEEIKKQGDERVRINCTSTVLPSDKFILGSEDKTNN